MTLSEERLRDDIAAVLPQVRDLRHELHQNPELSLCEFETRQRLLHRLARLPLTVHPPFLETDVVADLAVNDQPHVLLRADMDALPIHEASGVPYASLVPGVMHACGHDGHMAILYGAACVLSTMQEALPQPVRFVFQPGEEMVCAGRDLAPLVAESAIARYALHGWPGIEAGSIACCPGPMMAAAAFFEVCFHGQSCHGAMPHLGLSPMDSVARFVLAMQQFHETIHNRDGSVASVAVLEAGQATNAIPGEAYVRGTLRHLDDVQAAEDFEAVHRLAAEACAAGVTVSVTIEATYELPLVNSQSAYERIAGAAKRSARGWQQLTAPSMGAEDFAYYLAGREGAMFWVGLGQTHPGLHSSTFDFNDAVLADGILMFCLLALEPHSVQEGLK